MNVHFGTPADIDRWMMLVRAVSDHFPGLETSQNILDHQSTVLRFMGKNQALCAKYGEDIAGVLLFSRGHNMICCLAVAPAYRQRGVASALLSRALAELDRTRDITVSTFREDDEKGAAPRSLYKKFGFIEGELTVEFDYPNQQFVLHP